jgi:MFS family permease
MSGIITGPYFKSYFHQPDSLEIGTMVAVLEIGAFCTSSFFPWPAFRPDAAHQVTSLAAGRIGDIIGRKRTLFYGAVIFTIGGAVQTFSVGFWSMVLGRIISGCGVGLLSYVDSSLIFSS